MEESKFRSHQNQIVISGLLVLIIQVSGHTISSNASSTNDSVNVTKINDVISEVQTPQNNPQEELLQAPQIFGNQPFTLTTDPVTGQLDFNMKTVDINVLNQEKNKQNAEKAAIVQQDLQSRIKLMEEHTEKIREEPTEKQVIDPSLVLEKNARVKEDIESRISQNGNVKSYRIENDEYEDTLKYPIKRADVDYYEDEPLPELNKPLALPSRSTTEAPKEEESFFSIFESLFGGDEEPQSKQQTSAQDGSQLKDSNVNIKDIKNVGDILKPMRTDDSIANKKYDNFDLPPEHRIINDFQRPLPPKPNHRHPAEQPPRNSYHYQRPVPEKPHQPYRPYPTRGYEDYDLEEFMVKSEPKPTSVKYTTSTTTTKAAPTTTSTTTSTTTTSTTTMKNFIYYENTQRNPPQIFQEKNDFIHDKTEDEKRNEINEANLEKKTENSAHLKTEHTPTTEKHSYQISEEHYYDTKNNEVKSQSIQDSANFYNLINLPVRYSTKDTAIPLISTSYANTKIQGLGAHKYDKNNGKYPNHKYDGLSSTTKKPNYWSAKRTTQKTYQNPSTTKATTRYPSTTADLSDLEYDDMAIGSSADFGGYGHKAGVEIKIPSTQKRTETPKYKESTTRRNYDKDDGLKQEESNIFRPNPEKPSKIKEPEIKTEKTPVKYDKDLYDEYEYENENYPPQSYLTKPSKDDKDHKFSNYPNKNFDSDEKPTTEKKRIETTTPEYKTTQRVATINSKKPAEPPEYEYYEYDENIPTTTSKYKLKFPSLPKDKVKPANEKVAVVVPSKVKDYYEEQEPVITSSSTASPPSTTVSTTSSTTTSTSTTTTTTTSPTKHTVTEDYNKYKINTNHFSRPNQFNKEPAPVFEEDEESDGYNSKPIQRPQKIIITSTTQEPKIKPIIVTANKNDQENNVNIMLVPTQDSNKNNDSESAKPEDQKIIPNKYPNEMYHSHFEYTTEFTVGAVQGHSGHVGHGGHGHGHVAVQNHGHVPVQGHFVATSMSASPFGDSDEPFRPIARPPGMSASFQVIGDESELPQPPIEHKQQDKRPGSLPPPLHLEETEPIHEPHEFIPSPQFHRPGNPSKPSPELKPELTLDYDVDEIQTEPKPGQYVIFSKPQLNPEMNENQLKKKPEINLSNKTPMSIAHFHEDGNRFPPDNQKQVLYHQKPNVPETKPPLSKTEPKRPQNFELPEERPPLPLQQQKGTQTEEPFDGNFVIPNKEKPENTANYPRPHWEKNGKPGFLLNKNEIPGNRQPSLPPQMAPTLMPPSNAVPQRFRKPLPPNLPPIRKNFNEGTVNTKPKPNLPNILPQFRPNAKIGSGPYQRPFHRPPGYMNGNRRNGPHRYYEKENGNFPYHIQHPSDKELMHRDFEIEPGTQEIVPKFLTTRGKSPNELMDPYRHQKRHGMLPVVKPPVSPPKTIKDQKVLRRLQRTPVTTLQMLHQKPGTKTHKTPIRREDNIDPSAPLIPPVYKPYQDGPNSNENLYVVYPTKTHNKYPAYNPSKNQPNIKIENSETFTYNYTKPKDQYPLLNPTKRPVYYNEKPKNEFPYGFIKPDEKLKLNRKYPEDSNSNPQNNLKNSEKEIKPNLQDYMPFATKKPMTSVEDKDEKIDMNLHMQSNNQWNKVVVTEEDISIITQRPIEMVKSTELPSNDPNTPFRITEYPTGTTQRYGDGEIRLNPPSEYHTSIKDENNSAFTLGAVMHTVPENNQTSTKKGQVASVPLHDDEEMILPNINLNVNERISNGKIITVSMPLDVKEEPKEEIKIQLRPKETTSMNEQYQFQAPFQASSSVSSNEAEPTNQGWSIVKASSELSEKEDKNETVETTTNNTRFNFENFQPELQGGFKPIYELPEDSVEGDRLEEIKDREEKSYDVR